MKHTLISVTPQHMLLTATAPYYKSVTQVVSALYIGYVYAKHVLDILTERVICVCFEILALVYSNASCVSDVYSKSPNSFNSWEYSQRVQCIIIRKYKQYGARF